MWDESSRVMSSLCAPQSGKLLRPRGKSKVCFQLPETSLLSSFISCGVLLSALCQSKEGARPWPHQSVSHLCCPGSQNSRETGSLECSRCALECSCWGSHGQLEQPPRLPVPKCFSHHIWTMKGSTPTLEAQAHSSAWRITSTCREQENPGTKPL